MHAGAVSYGSDGILLIGSSGAGKTTTALYTCLLDPEISYITGNRVFLVELGNSIVYGVDRLSLRMSSIRNEYNTLGGLQIAKQPDFSSVDPSQMVQTFRVSLTSSQLNLTRPAFPLRPKAILAIRKMDSDLVVHEPKSRHDKELLLIYDALCEYSEKIPNIMLGSRIHYPDMFPDALKRQRLELARLLSVNMPVVYVEGRIEDLSTFIRDYLRQ